MNDSQLMHALAAAIKGTEGPTQSLLLEQLVYHAGVTQGSDPESAPGPTLDDVEPTGRVRRTRIVLIQCVANNERQGILQACRMEGLEVSGETTRGRFVLAEVLGRVGNYELLLVQTRAGSTGPTGAQGVVSDAIDDFDPGFVLAVGVAFGLKIEELDPDSPTIAIAETSKNYERARLGSDKRGRLRIHERSVVGHSDPQFSLNLRTLAQTIGLKVAYGEVLCGDKLVDNQKFRTILKERFPQAVAGEMEGTGLASACLRRRKPWAVVKGISDLGDGRKKEAEGKGENAVDEDTRQVVASERAMRLVLSAIGLGHLPVD